MKSKRASLQRDALFVWEGDGVTPAAKGSALESRLRGLENPVLWPQSGHRGNLDYSFFSSRTRPTPGMPLNSQGTMLISS